jgi:enoyl-CoA hydratase
LTGNYLNARDAERLGLVNRVVAADQLMAAAGELAHQILGADQRVVRQMKRLINLATEATLGDGLRTEQDFFRAFNLSRDFQAVAERRAAVVERGRSQTRR